MDPRINYETPHNAPQQLNYPSNQPQSNFLPNPASRGPQNNSVFPPYASQYNPPFPPNPAAQHNNPPFPSNATQQHNFHLRPHGPPFSIRLFIQA